MSNLWVLPTELGDMAESEYAYEAAKTASYLLWALSGRRFSGVGVVTERYTQTPDYLDAQEKLVADQSRIPTLTNLISRPMLSSRIRLRHRPVSEVKSIRLSDGTELSQDDYYLINHSTLQFRNAVPRDFEVTYTYGSPPPMAGRMAARMLAIEFAMLWSGNEECSLPTRVTSVSRQGITFTILDSQDFIDDLRTGVYAVDLFLKSVNPNKAQAKAKVFSIDIPRPRRVTHKPKKIAETENDILVAISGFGTTTLDLTEIGAEFLETDPGWTTEIIIRNWSEKSSLTLSGGSAVVSANTITITIPYEEAYSVLGVANPGTWDLYATKDEVTTYITSGNLQIKLDRY